MHDCTGCPRASTPEEAAACLEKKLKRQMSLPSFNQEAWDRVKNEVRPIMTHYWVKGEFQKMAHYWRRRGRYLVARASGGE